MVTANQPNTQARRPSRQANRLVSAILQSPFHRLISQQLMLITFRGRTSGKVFTTPVGYMRTAEGIVFFTDHQWWKNLVHQAPVTLLIEGKRLQGIPEVIADDQAVIERELQAYVEQRPGAARAYGIRFERPGHVQSESVQQAAQRFVLVRVTLT